MELVILINMLNVLFVMQNDYIKIGPRRAFPVKEIYLISHKEKKKNYSLQKQKHKLHELIYVDYGQMNLKCENQDYELLTGDCFLIKGGFEHQFYGEKGRPFDFLNITFGGKFSEKTFGQVFRLTVDERQLLQKLKQEHLEEPQYYRHMIYLYFNEFIFTLMRRNDFTMQKVTVYGENTYNYRLSIIKKVLNYLRQNYSQALDVKNICQLTGLSSSYLRSIIREGTGKNLRQHMMEIRVDTAKRLLRESPENVNLIAYKVGYQHSPHFCNVFKKITGKTPSQYAKSMK